MSSEKVRKREKMKLTFPIQKKHPKILYPLSTTNQFFPWKLQDGLPRGAKVHTSTCSAHSAQPNCIEKKGGPQMMMQSGSHRKLRVAEYLSLDARQTLSVTLYCNVFLYISGNERND